MYIEIESKSIASTNIIHGILAVFDSRPFGISI